MTGFQRPFSGLLWRHAVHTGRFYDLIFVAIIAILGYMTYQILSSFLLPIAWAAVFAIIFYPLFLYISRSSRYRAAAAAITVIIMLLVLAGPVSVVLLMLVEELREVSAGFDLRGAGTVRDVLDTVRSSTLYSMLRPYIGNDFLNEAAIVEGVKGIGRAVVERLTARVPNVISAAVNMVFVFLTTFFFLKDGPGWLSRLKDFMPFEEEQKRRLVSEIRDLVGSTVYGGVSVALVQGVLGGLAFYVLGIHSPVLWGAVMSVLSFVPLFGTFLIWGPAAIYLLLKVSYLKGLGLLAYGIFVISMVDNIMKPLIIGSRTSMPTILILFSVLGGIKVFGMIGFVLGPLITAVFLSVLDIFRTLEGGADS